MLQNTGKHRMMTLPNIPKFHLISWCENFVETHKSGIARNLAEKKFLHQEIRWNFGILRCDEASVLV